MQNNFLERDVKQHTSKEFYVHYQGIEDLDQNQTQKLSVLPETWTLGSFKSPSTCARTKQIISKTKHNL